jgi:methionyl-tRNA synthetase
VSDPKQGVYYITTPIYYVNDKPHIGHAYCTVLADVLARFHRLFGVETWFLTGVDEHGQKVQDAAAKRGMTPQQHCDDMQSHFRDLWPTLDVANDDFIRTTEPRHERVVQEALQRLWDKGEIYRGEYEGFYSPRVEKFFTEEELIDGKCPETGGDVYQIKEANYFFRMGKYQERLLQHIKDTPDFIRPESRRNEVIGFLQKPLQDLCISRPKSRLAWGIPLPFDTDFVTYVWFDALLNYCSAIGLYHDQERFDRLWPHVTHLIGKDILTTHSVYWTTMLMALELPLPRIIAHGWWLIDKTKMSKSLGNVVNPLSMKDKYGTDSLRYFLMREMVVGLDADFSETAFLKRHNYDLANDLGNLANRLVKFAERSMGGVVPEPGAGSGMPHDADLQAMALALPGRVRDLVGDLRVEQAVEATIALVRRVNRYVAETEPFKVIKTDPAAAAGAVWMALEALRFALNCLWPVMPAKCEALLVAIGAGKPEATLDALAWGGLKPGGAMVLESAPFPRFDVPEYEAAPEVAPAAVVAPAPVVVPVAVAAKPAPSDEPPARIAFPDFAKVDLRIGTVLVAEPVTGSDKLLRLQVDLGEAQPRQIVAGIGKAYAPADLVGRQIVVVANLEPRKVFGQLSNGMVLAASDDAGPAVLSPARPIPPGTKVS